ncbi:creatininase family protein [Chelatococcus asaccharovorans]|uniref:Creatinine amidohydrolase/Fe(II)-dependent formamide hydrolase-like protein n=1 Tax=Chelatococcus asaccharovorans TaxID=28210 RepID=A0A2V3TZF8_9HYPH|nr:creatininase family protein [Chelatococcus asaccharovorans]MBS7707695.1 creatininase family protein [Chelatococcus asaccharovorans]PXW55271.1 creatinine amidohydrolase/Fe(II)-dependent formamide hydrolase-like protein [Chelatococcus asaccharovorans]CAH1657651.1 Creatinine amidohydrolase/Fe(II)-dependent formamide hydrolase-like protein [Chelatococcus asaccharovorans]CAH1687558.1 Creatinine amidohydrolase/Fe(II)-dependent formamide hydrolase-like protein [Chelatococcus asaccharovorans]
MTKKGVWLEDLTWPEAKAWFDRDAVVIIPIGAASKEHGHALPLCTDYILARDITDRVLQEIPVVAAPVVNIAYFPAFRRFPGSQHISPATFAALLDEILSGFYDHGVRNMLIYNTGVSTEGTVENTVREFYARTSVRVGVAHILSLGLSAHSLLKQKLGGHACELETSMILELDEKRVYMDKLVTDYGNMLDQPKSAFYFPAIFGRDPNSGRDYTATGVRGDATLASKEKGTAIVSAIVDDIVNGIKAHYPDALAKSS